MTGRFFTSPCPIWKIKASQPRWVITSTAHHWWHDTIIMIISEMTSEDDSRSKTAIKSTHSFPPHQKKQCQCHYLVHWLTSTQKEMLRVEWAVSQFGAHVMTRMPTARRFHRYFWLSSARSCVTELGTKYWRNTHKRSWVYARGVTEVARGTPHIFPVRIKFFLVKLIFPFFIRSFSFFFFLSLHLFFLQSLSSFLSFISLTSFTFPSFPLPLHFIIPILSFLVKFPAEHIWGITKGNVTLPLLPPVITPLGYAVEQAGILKGRRW